jgi:hypothetical protein
MNEVTARCPMCFEYGIIIHQDDLEESGIFKKDCAACGETTTYDLKIK